MSLWDDVSDPVLRKYTPIRTFLLCIYSFLGTVKEAVAMFAISFSHFFRQWRAYDANLCRLSRLDDRALAAIGINRLEIPRLAWQKAERTV